MDLLLTQVPAMAVLLTVGLPLAGMVLAGFLTYIVLQARQQRIERVLETIRHLTERGLPVPPNLIELTEDRPSRQSPLFGAMSTLGAGVGLMLMFWMLGMRFLVGVGAMVACIGVAQLIALWLDGRRRRAAD